MSSLGAGRHGPHGCAAAWLLGPVSRLKPDCFHDPGDEKVLLGGPLPITVLCFAGSNRPHPIGSGEKRVFAIEPKAEDGLGHCF